MFVQAGSQLGDRLAACVTSGAVNLSLLTAAALATAFLPALLPAGWKGQREIIWHQPAGQTETIITEDWLQRLWHRLGNLPDLSLLADWPLVPVQGKRLCQANHSTQVGCMANACQISYVCILPGYTAGVPRNL